jgi:hypothetical protein
MIVRKKSFMSKNIRFIGTFYELRAQKIVKLIKISEENRQKCFLADAVKVGDHFV